MKLFLILCAMIPAALFAAPTAYDGIAATVNDKVVTVDTVLQELHNGFDLSQVPPEAREAKVRELFPVMRDLIIDRLLILQAYEDAGAQLPNEAITSRVQEIIARDFSGDKAKLQELLKKNRMTYDMWEKQIRENIIIGAMRHLQVTKKLNVSPAKIRLYFAEHMDEFATQGAVRVRAILLPPSEGRAVAEKALAELKKGTPFATVAKQYSRDEHAKDGGDWGFVVPENTFAPQVINELNQLKKGEFSDIIESSGYCTIIFKEAVKLGKTPTLQDAWPIAEQRLRAELGQARYKAWLDKLRADAHITTHSTVLK
ncbi:MAG: peptidyl-prolyl cis-trans isomerase [Kiritimatiellia bacterium]